MFLHFIIILNILLLGEFIFLIVAGYFNTSVGFTTLVAGTFKITYFSFLAGSPILMYQTQLLILTLFITITYYFVVDVKIFGKNSLKFLILLQALIILVSIFIIITTSCIIFL